MEKQLKLNVFIVPNGNYTLKSNRIESWRNRVKNSCKVFGIDMNDDDEAVQVWIHPTDPELDARNDNWTDHGVDQDYIDLFVKDESDCYKREGWKVLYAPAVLPYRFLKDKKEGDVIELTTKAGNKYQMTFNQLPHRYERFGTFEKCLNDLHTYYVNHGSSL